MSRVRVTFAAWVWLQEICHGGTLACRCSLSVTVQRPVILAVECPTVDADDEKHVDLSSMKSHLCLSISFERTCIGGQTWSDADDSEFSHSPST